MRTPISSLMLLPAALFLLITSPAKADLTGDTLTCAATPSFISSCSASSAVDGPGIEFTLTEAGNSLTADFGATGLVLTNPAASNTAFDVTFGPGIFFNFTDSTNPFTSATFLSSTNSLGAGNVSFSAGTLTLSVSGVTFTGGGTANIGLSTAPEPSSYLMLGCGLLGLVFFARKHVTSA